MGLGMMMVSVETMVTAVAATWPEAEKHMQTTLLGGDGKAEEPRTPDQRQQDSHLLQVTMVPAGSDANQAAHPVLGH